MSRCHLSFSYLIAYISRHILLPYLTAIDCPQSPMIAHIANDCHCTPMMCIPLGRPSRAHPLFIPSQVPVMHHVLQNISAQQVVRMRMAMASIWKPLLWTRGRRSSGHPKQVATLIWQLPKIACAHISTPYTRHTHTDARIHIHTHARTHAHTHARTHALAMLLPRSVSRCHPCSLPSTWHDPFRSPPSIPARSHRIPLDLTRFHSTPQKVTVPRLDPTRLQASFGRLKESVPPPSGYLGEDGQGDAFTTLMQVLRLRLSRECNGTTI